MVKRVGAIIVLVLVGAAFFPIVGALQERAGVSALAEAYLRGSTAELSTANAVTAVVVTYRGLDTLGEVTVLFAASAGVALVLANTARRQNTAGRQTDAGRADAGAILPATLAAGDATLPAPSPAFAPSELLQTGAALLVPVIVLFGAFIFVHGHLTPGGGFQGGVVVASGVLLYLLAGRIRGVSHVLVGALEAVAGLAYVGVGAMGLWLVGSFLDPRFLPLGDLGRLFSGGAIPIIYSVIGVKVGSELSALVDTMRSRSVGDGTTDGHAGRLV